MGGLMTQARLSKAHSYFSRFKVKHGRRREYKTDFRARSRLIIQDINKYGASKYRMVVRFSNKDIICQVIYSTIFGDKTICSSYARELPHYGLKVGLTNYSAAYCVGLLCARRCIAKIGSHSIMHKTLPNDESKYSETGNTPLTPLKKEHKPFTVFLDSGLKRTSSGSKIFAVLKGAVDGGLNIPHTTKRFVGYNNITKKYDQEVMNNHIFGEHVAQFMEELKFEDEDGFQRQFSQYINFRIKPRNLSTIYKTVHHSIRQASSYPKLI